MLTGDETGWLLGDYVLSQLDPDVAASSIVASTIVSSRMLAAIAASHGAEHVETLTGFKWLARADAGRAGATLVYAYEEAIGHCVDPAAVRDKDGISAAVLACDLVAALRAEGRTVSDALDDLARRYGVHLTTAVSVETDADAVMAALRADPPTRVADEDVAVVDLLDRRGQQRTDALIYTGETLRLAVRPSGTEPKVKAYLEVRLPAQEDLRFRSRARRTHARRGEGRGGRSASARAELTVPRVAEPRHDVGDVVQSVVDGGGEQP